jgi:bisphosphoglycerate-independent phosphoglycerate mutase (AlkP superfamily)
LQSGGGGVATAINKRYHTVDRNQRLSREQKSSTMQQQQKTNQQRTSTTSTSVNGYSQYPPGKPSGK